MKKELKLIGIIIIIIIFCGLIYAFGKKDNNQEIPDNLYIQTRKELII